MLHYYLPTDALNTVEIRNKDGRELDNRVYDKVCAKFLIELEFYSPVSTVKQFEQEL